MARTKISEFSATPANNTDIDSINIAEGCAPSGINDAIRELMAQLKDFQTGAVGDSFNGPIGTSTAAAGAFTTLSATGAITSTLATGTAPLVIASTTKVANLNVDLLDGADWASPAALGSTTPAAGSFTTLGASSTATLNTLVSSGATLTGGTINGMTIGATTASTGAFTTLSASSTVTLSGGTANGVAYLNGSKVVTSGSALTFDGTNLGVGTASPVSILNASFSGGAVSGTHSFAFGYPYAANLQLKSTNAGTSVSVASVGLYSNPERTKEFAFYNQATDARVGYLGYQYVSGSAVTDLTLYNTLSGSLIFGTNNAEGMRLTSTGLGIGTRKDEVNPGHVQKIAKWRDKRGKKIFFLE